MIDEDDIRLGVSAFNVGNEMFSRYNDCKPLFEENVKNGKPQIFILLKDNYVDVNRCAAFAEEHKISFAQEFGIDPITKIIMNRWSYHLVMIQKPLHVSFVMFQIICCTYLKIHLLMLLFYQIRVEVRRKRNLRVCTL